MRSQEQDYDSTARNLQKALKLWLSEKVSSDGRATSFKLG